MVEVKFNTDQAIRMMENYIKKVEGKLERVLDDGGRMVKRNQQRKLNVMVKHGTGKLQQSIMLRKADNSVSVGPNTAIAPYAPYVELGTEYFEGYHFVRDSLDNMQLPFEKMIKEAL